MKQAFSSIFFALLLFGCDRGLAPLDIVDPEGTLIVNISYTGDWPPSEEIFEFRFIAFRFKPILTSDFTRITEMVISDRLEYFVDSQTIVLENVRNGDFPYSAIGWQFGSNIFQDWRPAGIYDENGGFFRIQGNEVEINIEVDFDNLPTFPPEAAL